MKRKVILGVMALFLLMSGGALLAQSDPSAPFQEGVHYFEIDQAPVRTSNTIELTEVFSYLCTHCNTFEPYMESWLKHKPDNVEFDRIPAVFGRASWEIYARAYITAQMMKAPNESHIAMMDRLWKDKEIMRSMDELADFYSKFGLDRDKFLATSQSFAVDSKLRRDQQRIQDFGIQGTPSVVLNGKYRISGNAAVSNYDVLMEVVDYLVAKETAEMNNAAATEVASADTETDSR